LREARSGESIAPVCGTQWEGEEAGMLAAAGQGGATEIVAVATAIGGAASGYHELFDMLSGSAKTLHAGAEETKVDTVAKGGPIP
jgi:hypothetical protein